MQIEMLNSIYQATGKESPVAPLKASPITAGGYDKDLQMFIEPTAELNLEKLRFLRWLAEHGELEHEIFSAPQGPLAEVVAR